MQQQMGGEAARHRRRGRAQVDRLGQPDEPRRRQDAIGGVGAERMADIGDPIADREIGDARAERRDDAGPFDAERRRIGGQRIETAAVIDVDVVHAGVALADARFARPGRRQRDFARAAAPPGRPGRRWSWRGSSWRSSQSPFSPLC